MQCYTCFYTCSGAISDDGDTPLDIATQFRHTEIADYLKSLLIPPPVTSDPLSGQQTPSAGNEQLETTGIKRSFYSRSHILTH